MSSHFSNLPNNLRTDLFSFRYIYKQNIVNIFASSFLSSTTLPFPLTCTSSASLPKCTSDLEDHYKGGAKEYWRPKKMDKNGSK